MVSPGFNGAATARSRMAPSYGRRVTRSRCFNGAATARSRMEAQLRRAGGRGRRFNGAATARSRMADWRIVRLDPVPLLQWGRDR